MWQCWEPAPPPVPAEAGSSPSQPAWATLHPPSPRLAQTIHVCTGTHAYTRVQASRGRPRLPPALGVIWQRLRPAQQRRWSGDWGWIICKDQLKVSVACLAADVTPRRPPPAFIENRVRCRLAQSASCGESHRPFSCHPNAGSAPGFPRTAPPCRRSWDGTSSPFGGPPPCWPRNFAW